MLLPFAEKDCTIKIPIEVVLDNNCCNTYGMWWGSEKKNLWLWWRKFMILHNNILHFMQQSLLFSKCNLQTSRTIEVLARYYYWHTHKKKRDCNKCAISLLWMRNEFLLNNTLLNKDFLECFHATINFVFSVIGHQCKPHQSVLWSTSWWNNRIYKYTCIES